MSSSYSLFKITTSLQFARGSVEETRSHELSIPDCSCRRQTGFSCVFECTFEDCDMIEHAAASRLVCSFGPPRSTSSVDWPHFIHSLNQHYLSHDIPPSSTQTSKRQRKGNPVLNAAPFHVWFMWYPSSWNLCYVLVCAEVHS